MNTKIRAGVRGLLAAAVASVGLGVVAASPAAAVAVPVNSAPPTISTSGADYTADPGAWSNAPTAYDYQWQRCDGGGANCADHGGTDSTYTATGRDLGYTLRVLVTAHNVGGASVAAPSATTGVVSVAIPANTIAPTITGSAVVGRTLTGHHGTWVGSGGITYQYQWQVCPLLISCIDRPSAHGLTYVVSQNDYDKVLKPRIRLVVTAVSAPGNAEAHSNATATVVQGGPLNVTRPAVTGTVARGHTLTTSNASWRGTPTISVTAYRWLRCNSAGGACVTIAGATHRTYVVSAADHIGGHRLRSVVYVKNPIGTANATSAGTAIVG